MVDGKPVQSLDWVLAAGHLSMVSGPFYTSDPTWSIDVDTSRMVARCSHVTGAKVALSLVHVAYR